MNDKEAISQGLRVFTPPTKRQKRAFREEESSRAAAYILYRAFFPIREIAHILHKSPRTINIWIRIVCVKYGERKNY